MDHLKKLGEQKETMEEEILVLTESLNGPGLPGLHGNLVDSEGFPRADINIPEVRSMRGRIATL